jgi:hypothetical protein
MKVAVSSIWRFYDRHKITFKKTLRAAEQDRPDFAAARAELKAENPVLNARRLVFNLTDAPRGGSASSGVYRTGIGRR